MFGRYPSYPISKDTQEATIRFYDHTRAMPIERTYDLTKHEIEELRKACSPVWLAPIPSGSMEGLPRWRIEFKGTDETTKLIQVTRDEIQGTRNPPTNLLNLLNRKYS